MSSSIKQVVQRAYTIAAERRHELVTLEHLLSSLLENSNITDVITAMGSDPDQLKTEVDAYLDDSSNHVLVKGGAYHPRHTSLLMTVLKKVKTQSFFSNKTEMGDMELFLAIFNIENSYASYFLQVAGLEKEAVLQHINKKNKSDELILANEAAQELLGQFCVNLNERAKLGKIDPVIGREEEIENIAQILSRRTKNNVIMLGDPGVGKTQIIEGLAKRIVDGNVPETLIDSTIWSLDMASMVAGTKFRGDFEERMKQVVSAFAAIPTAIMFIDEIHMIMGAGSGNQSTMDAANLLKPALSRGDLRCIGSTTSEEYRKHFEKDRALGRRFQKIEVNEPSIDDAKRILAALVPAYSQHHGIAYDPAAVQAAVELSARYIHGRCLPDKAIDVIDSAGARQKIKLVHDRCDIIGIDQIKDEISRIARVQIDIDDSSDRRRLERLETDLRKAIHGQDEAVNKLADAVLVSRSGLRDHSKTQGAFLFTGPTGVGKTEISKQLARLLNVELVRFDMSEFQEKHTVSRLVGSPPGYIGYGDGQAGNGTLINALERHPDCVLLCDEVEKAHPDILSIFLQIMDHGMITNQSGKQVSARNAIIIFTSNLGAAEMEKRRIGFGASNNDDAGQDAVNRWFAPEFRNRLDAVIHFNRLTIDNMSKILDKFLVHLNNLTQPKNVRVVFDQDAKKWLIDRGFDPLMGARPLSKVIDEHVKRPLSREMLFGKLSSGGSVIFRVKDNRLLFEMIETGFSMDDIDAETDDVERIST